MRNVFLIFFFTEGCPKNCNNHGECITGEDDDWVCFCEQHWDGPDCSIPLERKCDDNVDNDNGEQLQLFIMEIYIVYMLFLQNTAIFSVLI